MRKGFLGFIAFLVGATTVAAQPPGNPATATPIAVHSEPGAALGDFSGSALSGVPTPGGPPGCFWVNAEYLLWFIKDGHVPPLVSVGPASSGAILGRGATSVFGPGSDIDGSIRSGGRFTAGRWLDEDQTWGLEAGYFFLGSSGKNFSLAGDGSPGSPAIGRPFFNPIPGAEDAEIVAFPGVVAGRVGVSTSSFLQGAEANVLCNLCCGCNYRVDALAGLSYFNLSERVRVTENLAVLPGVAVIGGTHFDIFDSFQAHNHFYGGQVGARTELRWGRLYTDLLARVASGVVTETVDVSGATRSTAPTGVATTQPGGFLALPTNIGHHTRNQFAVLPEGRLAVGYQVTESLRAWIGYTFLYCSNVVRPGDQIDRVVNPTLLPTTGGAGVALPPARPAFSFHDSDFWAQGVSFGVELRF
jgi:hypothetical protein